jgi:HD domain
MTPSGSTSIASSQGRIRYRLRQGLGALRPGDAGTVVDPGIADPRLASLFKSLSSRDRRHLVEVWRVARECGDDPDLHVAALFHDIGKVTLSGKHVSLLARVLVVLADHLPRQILARLRPDREGAWPTGLRLAEHHAGIGADRLRALGVSEAACWLVEQHDNRELTDERLLLLREIDSKTL